MKPKITGAKPAFVSRSPETGTDYTIYVDAPRVSPYREPLAAVLLMDGDFLFDPAVEACRSLRERDGSAGRRHRGGIRRRIRKARKLQGPRLHPDRLGGRAEQRPGGPVPRYLSGTLWPELARRMPLRATGGCWPATP